MTKLENHEADLRLYHILTSIVKDKPDEYLRLERKLSAELIKHWRTNYEDALKELLKLLPENLSSEGLNIILDGLTDTLGNAFGLSLPVRKEFRNYITKAYELGKNSSLNLPDRRAIEVLTRHNCFWLGQHYGKNIGPKIAELSRNAIENGLGRKELAKELRESLGGKIGGYEYWDVVSSSALVRARSFGAIAGMVEAGITEYEIVAMGDERMCEFCGQMDGKKFYVQRAAEKIQSVLDIEDPEEFKDALPWGDDEDGLPPFHGRCRCVLVSV